MRRKPTSVAALTELGRVRLSKRFFMRDMLHSEIAQVHGLLNAPEDPELAIEVGTRLCEELLEPLQERWGPMRIRSAYRSREVNALGNELQREGKAGYNCATNEANAAGISGTCATPTGAWARWPASCCPPSTTRIRRRAAGRCWRGGSTTTSIIRSCGSIRGCGRSTSAGTNGRSGGSTAMRSLRGGGRWQISAQAP